MSNKQTDKKYEFFFQFNEEEPTSTKITGAELKLTVTAEQCIEFISSDGNVFKIFGRTKNEQ